MSSTIFLGKFLIIFDLLYEERAHISESFVVQVDFSESSKSDIILTVFDQTVAISSITILEIHHIESPDE